MKIQEMEFNIELRGVITPHQANYYKILPVKSETDFIEFIISENQMTNNSINDELELIFNKEIRLNPKPYEEIEKLLRKNYRIENSIEKKENITSKISNDFLFKIIQEASDLSSSDIHLETYEEYCRIRIRIDGLLVERYTLPKDQYKAIVNKIKIQANLDIAEKRLPQDGRINFESDNKSFDIRVSILPTLYGEKIVLRLLSKDSTNIDIKNLGFNEKDLSVYLEGIKKPNGIILISGPTGSGKTTTLYATLKILNKETRNILTIEDPIEYTVKGINQVQLKEDIGLNFASALRTFLRQDPDVIMVGEIRDAETANMAIRASLTGHLVLSTIHTNSAWGTIARLIDLNVPSYLIANTLNLSVAQRLVRLLCPYCKLESKLKIDSVGVEIFTLLQKEDIDIYFQSNGCEKCFHTGYKGRKAVYEIIPIDAELSTSIKSGISNVYNILKKAGIKTLADDAIELLRNGLSSIEEVYPLLQINYY